MITSTTNGKVKRLTALTHKAKARRNEGVFIAEGIKMVLEAPKDWIQEVYTAQSFLAKCQNSDNQKNRQLIEALSCYPHETVSDEVYKKISDTQTPQGVLAVLRQPQYCLEQAVLEQTHDRQLFFLILENIQDPGNLGTIVRAGEGAGVDGIIITSASADIFNPKVIRSQWDRFIVCPFILWKMLWMPLRCCKKIKRRFMRQIWKWTAKIMTEKIIPVLRRF